MEKFLVRCARSVVTRLISSQKLKQYKIDGGWGRTVVLLVESLLTVNK
jgi:hypothetical protein